MPQQSAQPRTIAIAAPAGALAHSGGPGSRDAGRCGALAAIQRIASALALRMTFTSLSACLSAKV